MLSELFPLDYLVTHNKNADQRVVLDEKGLPVSDWRRTAERAVA